METGADEKSYSGFAFGSRDGEICQPGRGVAIGGLCERGQGERGIGDGNNFVTRRSWLVTRIWMLTYNIFYAFGEDLRDKVVAINIGAFDGNEDIAGFDEA